jgi:copper(I)-binding protein
MLMDLKAPLAKDGSVALTLTFRNARGVESQQQVNVPVGTGMAPGGAPGHMQDHGNHPH